MNFFKYAVPPCLTWVWLTWFLLHKIYIETPVICNTHLSFNYTQAIMWTGAYLISQHSHPQ